MTYIADIDAEELQDCLSDALSDSFDVDWTAVVGARYCVEALKRDGYLNKFQPISTEEALRACRQLPLEGDAGCDKLTDAEWLLVIQCLRGLGIMSPPEPLPTPPETAQNERTDA